MINKHLKGIFPSLKLSLETSGPFYITSNIRLHKYLISWQFPPSCAGRVGTDRRMEQFMKYFSSSRTICSGAFPIIFLKLGPQPASFCLLVIKKQINRRLALMNNDWCTATWPILYLVWFCNFIAPINSPHAVYFRKLTRGQGSDN